MTARMTAVVFASIMILSTGALAEEEKRYSSVSEHPQDVYFGDPHIPTRISTDAAMWGTTMGPEVPMTTQERANTSPIWVIPAQ